MCRLPCVSPPGHLQGPPHFQTLPPVPSARTQVTVTGSGADNLRGRLSAPGSCWVFTPEREPLSAPLSILLVCVLCFSTLHRRQAAWGWVLVCLFIIKR